MHTLFFVIEKEYPK